MRQARIGFLCAAVALAAGCGGGPKGNGEAGKPATQIVADAEAAAKNASAVHVSGSGTTGGRPIKLDLYFVAGKGARGKLTVSGLTFDIIRVGEKAYIRGGASFWRNFGGGAAAALLQGRWLTASASKGDFAAFAPLTDISQFFHAILANHGKISKGGTATVGGQKAITVIDHANQGGTLYVATTGKPYPLQLVSPKGQHGTITFDGWNKPTAIAAPKNALDLTALKKLGG